MTKIKAVGFDYGGVIGGGARSDERFRQEICRLLNISEELYLQEYYSINHLINTGIIPTWREFWPLFLQKLKLPLNRVDDLMELSAKYAKISLKIDPKMVRLIDQLRAKGYAVGLLSNTTLDMAREMRAAKLDSHFDAFLISSEIKVQKPSVAAFEILRKELGVKMSEMAFVDDTEKSLDTAQVCGFVPILFESYETLVADLETLLPG